MPGEMLIGITKSLQAQIDDLRIEITRARSTIDAKQKELELFCQEAIATFSKELPSNFTDQNFAELTERLQSYKSQKASLQNYQGQLRNLRLQSESIERVIEDWVERKNAVERLISEISGAMQTPGIQVNQKSIKEAYKQFEEACKSYNHWREAKLSLENALQTQSTVKSSLPELESDRERTESKITEIVQNHPQWNTLSVSGTPEVYEKAVQNLSEKANQEHENFVRIKDEINQKVKNLRHLAELEEEMDLAQTELRRLNQFGSALELAKDELTTSTLEFQKMFAPRLEQTVEEGLGKITERRYCRVKVDPNSLDVNVLAPEKNTFVPTELLSTGTRDLIFLILRMGIARMMSSSGESLPLLLDDPFVEFDSYRKQASLDFVIELASHTQILLFSKDQEIYEHLQKEGKDFSKIIELEECSKN